MSVWKQKEFSLARRSRGCYLVTNEVEKQIGPELSGIKIGLCNIFIQHTSCGLTINENADPDVRKDMTTFLNALVDKGTGHLFVHTAEGDDDMPGHVKSSLMGASVTIPITNGRLNLGTWQGIWLVEARDAPHTRTVVATIQGQGS